MSSVQPTLSTVLDLKPTFGWVFIGTMFSGVFYGVTVVQTLFYTYPNDINFLKFLVAGLWILDTLSLILISHGTYTWLVIDYANPLALNDIFCPSQYVLFPILKPTPATADLISRPYSRLFPLAQDFVSHFRGLVQAINAYHRTRHQPLPSWGAQAMSLLFSRTGSFTSYDRLTTTGGFAVFNLKLRVGVTDSHISERTLIRNLLSKANTQDRTNKMISTLMVYLITNNLLTSLIATSELIVFFAAPRTLVFEALNVIMSKENELLTLLSSGSLYQHISISFRLNARQSIRGRGIISTQGPTVKNTGPVAVNLGPMSGTNGEELDFEAADPMATTVGAGRDSAGSSAAASRSGESHDRTAIYTTKSYLVRCVAGVRASEALRGSLYPP
ncbi:hypothetical protein BD779DRAFT_1480916 [Infundibulicybe gibba]|nr:hypothetical protein BD779DRAFT_1480916 [Infundibulicybe gibba]